MASIKKYLCRIIGCESTEIKKDNTVRLTCGEPDEDGFADTYWNGEKTNARILLFDKEKIKRMYNEKEE